MEFPSKGMHRLAWCLTTCSLLSSVSYGQEPSAPLPKAHEPLLDEAVDELFAVVRPGFEAMADESGSAGLVEIVKTLRAFGYGSQPKGGRVGSDRQGRGGRHGGQGGPAARFARLDSDADGKLRGAEIGPRMQDDARAADGEITLEEFEAVWAEMFGGGERGRRGQRGGNRGSAGRSNSGDQTPAQSPSGPGGRRGRGSQGAESIGDAQFVLLFDSDRDRKVTPDELKSAVRKDLTAAIEVYARHDANGDGTIDAAELRNAPDSDGGSAAPLLRIRLVDENQDGDLSVDEIVAFVKRRSQPRLQGIAACLRLHNLAESDQEDIRKTALGKLFETGAPVATGIAQADSDVIRKSELYQFFRSVYRAPRSSGRDDLADESLE